MTQKTPATPSMSQNPDNEEERGDRIAKVMARLGVASRRDAEKIIADGRVTLNGEAVTTPATFVKKGDVIAVDGERLGRKQKTRLFLYHKPPGLITTAKDPEGRPTVFQSLPKNLPRLISVGRLDLNTEGLLLLTNDGELSRALELPATGLKRTYRVRVYGDYGGVDVLAKKLEKLKKGLFWKGVRYGAIDAAVDEQQKVDGHNYWITMTLTEGKNREIRNVLEAIGYRVSRLIRTAYGPFELGTLNREEVVEVTIQTIKTALPPHVVEKVTG